MFYEWCKTGTWGGEMSQEGGKKMCIWKVLEMLQRWRSVRWASNVNQRVCDIGASPQDYVCSKWRSDASRLPNVSRHENANATGSCAALRLPLPSMIVVSRRHDAKFSPTFINSWQRAPPEFPMIPPVLCVILPHLSLFARSHSVPLMAELLTLFLVLCTLDTALIFPACVTEHLL